MQHVTFSKYVIQGKVEDERGKGVWGIALLVGREMVVSGTDGSFFVHVNNKPIPFAVAAGASLQSLRWSLVSAPTSVQGRPEGSAESVHVIIRMGNLNQEIAQSNGK
jgi:hypothetical protein